MTRRLTGTDATRAREFINRQAALPWPSEDRDGREIPGSIGTTSIRDVVVPEGRPAYLLLEGREEHLVSEARGARSRLTIAERPELEDIITRIVEDVTGGGTGR